jgi:branched-chain amino acid transport system permease protein
LNFAHGGVATLAGFVAYGSLRAGAPYWLAAAAAIVAGIAISIAIETFVVRPLAGESDVTVAIGTIGAGLILIGAVTMLFGTTQVALRGPIESAASIAVGPIVIGVNQLLAIVVTLILTAALLLVLDRTRIGLAIRAASEGPLTAQMLGISLVRIRTVIWGISGALAAVAALLIVPNYYLDPNFITDFMIVAFVAVVLGGFESIVGVLAGGVLFGVMNALFSFYFTERLTNSFAFFAIMLFLLVFPHGLFGHRLLRVPEPLIGGGRAHLLPRIRLPIPMRQAQLIALVVAIAFTIVAPFTIWPPYVFALASVAAMFLAVGGQNVISGYSGQFAIGQSGFMVIGAYVSVLLAAKLHCPFPLAALIASVVTAFAGLCFGFPAIRLSGVYLALLSMLLALAMPELAAFRSDLGGAGLGMQVPTAYILGFPIHGTTPLYWVAVAVFWLVGIALYAVCNAAPGRSWIAVRDSELGAASIGINVIRKKLETFTLGAGLAGLSGAMSALLVGYLSPDSFTFWLGIFLFIAVIIGGQGSALGSVLGAAFVVLVPIALSRFPELAQLAYGVALLIVLLVTPAGLASIFTATASAARERT